MPRPNLKRWSPDWPGPEMSRHAARLHRTALMGAVLVLAGCAAPKPKPPALPPPPPLDASYDWHVLLIAPFGSVLKDVPATLHEVLLFRDEARTAAAADELECYAVDSKPPRFVARPAAEYLLCFRHDRLSRIEATVRLPVDEAAKIFADACGLWAKSGQSAAEGCEGTDRGIAYLGHLDSEPQGSVTAMAVQLDAADSSAEHAPDRQ
jgi:hypothetical protein